MKSLDFKLMNLKKAYGKLKDACENYDFNEEIIRDGLIQRFEFTYELCHKTLIEFFKYQGVVPENTFPRTIYKKAYTHNLISDEKIWISLMDDRNSTSHIYNENLASDIAFRIVNEYVSAIGELILNLENMI